MNRKKKIGLIYGGKSGEHEVSLQTAFAVLQSIDFSKYDITPFYITKKCDWKSGPALTAPVSSKEMLMFGDREPAALDVFGGLQKREVVISSAIESQPETSVDVVLPLLHGTFGEDGTIQGLFEMANIPYAGAGVLASAVGMDKVIMKKVFAQEDLPQCVFRHFTRSQWQKDQPFFLMELEISIGYPCFIKPANLGSSVGISKARNRDELIKAVEEAFKYDRKVIIEEFVEAREIEVAVLGNEEPEVSVPGEIISSKNSDFYDYKAKYQDGNSIMVIPADIPEETAAQIQELAIRAFKAIDGSGLSRVDFFMRNSDGHILINEINTMPGFTPFSMYPLLWKESGKPYAQLLDELIDLALERHAEKQKLKYSMEN